MYAFVMVKRTALWWIFLSFALLNLPSCSEFSNQNESNGASSIQWLTLAIVQPFMNDHRIDYTHLEASTRGRLLTSQRKWVIPFSYINIFVDAFLSYTDASLSDYPAFTPQHPVSYYAITYETLDHTGNSIIASGGVWIPDGKTDAKILSFGHGTHMNSVIDSVSGPRGFGILYSTRGYITAIADYQGYGASESAIHPYLHAESLAASSIDMIRATTRFLKYNKIPYTNHLYLTGVSEGGMASLSTLKEIQSNPSNYTDLPTLKATAPISGPYDMSSTTEKYLQQNTVYGSRSQPGYIGFVIPAYNTIYSLNRDLTYYFKEPYASTLSHSLFPRSDYPTVVDSFPLQSSEFLTDEFLLNFNGTGETEMKGSISSNNTYNFAPATPVHLYASDGDTVVPASNARTAYDYFVAHGATDPNLTVLPATSGDHVRSAIDLVAKSLQWFEAYH